MTARLDGRVAVVTGGASGIGRACALRFADEGADVLIADLNADRGRETAKEIEARGRRAVVVEIDTTREDDCAGMAAAAVSELGRLDVLLAAAGISHAGYVSGAPSGPARGDLSATFLLNKPLANWQKVLDVNLTGVMLTCQAAARKMVESGNGGSIVTIASGAAKLAIPGAGDYCVSKAGVLMLTKVLALELAGARIRANCIGPGFIATPMTASLRENDAAVSGVLQRTPLGRLGEPEDIAATAAFLASDDASFVTGEFICPDGGLMAAERT